MDATKKDDEKPSYPESKVIWRAFMAILALLVTGLMVRFIVSVFAHLKQQKNLGWIPLTALMALIFIIVLVLLAVWLLWCILLDCSHAYTQIMNWMFKKAPSTTSSLTQEPQSTAAAEQV